MSMGSPQLCSEVRRLGSLFILIPASWLDITHITPTSPPYTLLLPWAAKCRMKVIKHIHMWYSCGTYTIDVADFCVHILILFHHIFFGYECIWHTLHLPIKYSFGPLLCVQLSSCIYQVIKYRKLAIFVLSCLHIFVLFIRFRFKAVYIHCS